MQASQHELFSSLEELLCAQEELLKTVPKDGAPPLSEVANLSPPILKFMHRVSLTGKQLDRPQDRRTAQNVLNYWAIGLTSSNANIGDAVSSRADTMLRPFDREAQEKIAFEAGKLITSFSTTEHEFARRVLFALVELRDERAHFALLWRAESKLLKLAPAAVGSKVLTALRATGTLVSREDENDVELRFCCEALLRVSAWTADLAKERVKFRDAALFWEQSGRNSGALLSPFLAIKAQRDYQDFTPLERDFIRIAVLRRTKRWTTLMAVCICALMAYYPFTNNIMPWLRNLHETKIDKEAHDKLNRLQSGTSDANVQSEAVRWLADNGPNRYFAKLRLNDLNLSGLKVNAPNMVSIQLTRVDLSNSELNGAVLINSVIIGSRFDDSSINRARFDQARIQDTTFNDADLTQAVFSRARLCDVNFANSDVKGASFYNVDFDLDHPPNFLGSAWWLASGWSLAQTEALQKGYGNDQAFRASGRFQRLLTDARERVEAANENKSERAKSDNDLAWLLATYGANLEEAEVSARHALSLAESLQPVTRTDDLLSTLRDTLGYVLLEQNKIVEALTLLTDAAKVSDDGEITFRKAIAHHAVGDEASALEELQRALVTKGYVPSHELRNLISLVGQGGFHDKLASYLLRGRTTPGEESTCTSLRKSHR